MFGLYSRGPHYGISNTSKDMPQVSQYLSAVLKNASEQVGSDVQSWTSFSIGLNAGSTVHRDCHNLPHTRNLLVGLGDFAGGELWRACDPEEGAQKGLDIRWKVQKDGRRVRGVQVPTLNQVVTFNPFLPHATCKWTGRRYVLSAYTSGGLRQADGALRHDLRKVGFPVPQAVPKGDVVASVLPSDPQESEPWQDVKPLDSELRKSLLGHAQEYVNDVEEILDVFPQAEAKKVTILEIGSPNSHLHEAARRYHGAIHNCRDRDLDVCRARDVKMLQQFLHEVQPDWLWLAPVYELPQQEGRSERATAQSRKRCKQAAATCLILAQEQLRTGRHVLWIWPESTSSWTRGNVREYFRFMKQSGQMFEAHVHACQVDNRGPADQPRDNQRWRIWSSSSSMSQCLSSTCEGGHLHVAESAKCAHSGAPATTCARALNEMQLQQVLQRQNEEAMVSEHECAFENMCGDVMAAEELADPEKLTRDEKVAHAQLMKLHRRCGHPSNRALLNLLRTREVEPHVLRIAANLQCDVCQQLKLAKPHNAIALDRSEQLWHTLQIDHVDFGWGEVVVQALVLVDEASQYVLVHEVHRRPAESSKNATTEEVIHALETVWAQRHGYPNKIRLDAEGAFRGSNLGNWASEAGIELDVIPAEDHGQIGGVERMGGALKHHAHVLMQANPDMDPFRALALMAGAHNENQFVNGYTPVQRVFGRQFSHDRRLFDGGHAVPLHSSEGTPGTSFQENLQTRIKAEVVFKKAQAARRVTLAMNTKTRPHEVFIPGDL